LTEFWNAAERRQPTVHVCGRARHGVDAATVHVERDAAATKPETGQSPPKPASIG
jgi:hypothetical protein